MAVDLSACQHQSDGALTQRVSTAANSPKPRALQATGLLKSGHRALVPIGRPVGRRGVGMIVGARLYSRVRLISALQYWALIWSNLAKALERLPAFRSRRPVATHLPSVSFEISAPYSRAGFSCR